MNGRTHNLIGIATVTTTTTVAIKLHSCIITFLPEPVATLLSPPNAILFGINGNNMQISNSATAIAMQNASANGNAINLRLDAQNLETGANAIASATATVSASATSAMASVGTTGAIHASADMGIAIICILLVGIIGGQFPDIDQPNSTIANSGRAVGKLAVRYGGFKRNGLVSMLITVVAWFVNLLPRTMAYIANHYFGGHRGEVHTLLAVVVVSTGVGLVTGLVWQNPFFGVLFALAYISHLVVDSFTRSGVNWFAPFNRKDYHLLPRSMQFRSDSDWQNLLVQIVAMVVIALALFLAVSGALPQSHTA